MNRLTAVVAAAGAAILAAIGPTAAGLGPEPVEIRHGDGLLKAFLYLPDGSGPFPVVIGMHGCEGLRSPDGTINTANRPAKNRMDIATRLIGTLLREFLVGGGRIGSNSACRIAQALHLNVSCCSWF